MHELLDSDSAGGNVEAGPKNEPATCHFLLPLSLLNVHILCMKPEDKFRNNFLLLAGGLLIL